MHIDSPSINVYVDNRNVICSNSIFNFIGFVNVHNLKRKIIIPEFCNLISEFDIFACAETKLTDLDSIDMCNFSFFASRSNVISHKVRRCWSFY